MLVYHVIMMHLFALSHSFHLFHINWGKHHQRMLPLAAFKLHKTNKHKQAYERKNARRTIIENEIPCLYHHLNVIARFVWSLVLCSCFTVSKFYLLLLRAIAPLWYSSRITHQYLFWESSTTINQSSLLSTDWLRIDVSSFFINPLKICLTLSRYSLRHWCGILSVCSVWSIPTTWAWLVAISAPLADSSSTILPTTRIRPPPLQ